MATKTFEEVKAVYDSLLVKKSKKDSLIAQQDKLVIERNGIEERLQEIYPGKNWQEAYKADIDLLVVIQEDLKKAGIQ